jgi:glycine cleavage system H protein
MTDFIELTVDKFTFRIATDRDYDPQGLWLLETPGGVRVGLSDYLQQRIGDVAFAEVQPEGTALGVGDELASLETIKVSLAVASPLTGTLGACNALLETEPEVLNADPYGDGWLADVVPSAELSAGGEEVALLTPEEYLALIEVEARDEVGSEDEA